MNPCKMMWFSYMMVISCVALTGSTGFCANGAIEGQVTLIGGGNTGHGIVIAISGGVAYGHYTVRFGPGYDGYYKIPQLPPGTYELHTQKEGYEYGFKKGVSVLSGQITTVYVALYPEGIITGKVTKSDQTDPTPDYVPHVIREFSTFCVVYCAGRGVAETEAIHAAANWAGVLYPKLLCGRWSLYSSRQLSASTFASLTL